MSASGGFSTDHVPMSATTVQSSGPSTRYPDDVAPAFLLANPVTRAYISPSRNATSVAPPTGAMRLGRQLAMVVLSPVSGATREILPATVSVTYSAPSGPTVLPK